MSDWAKIVWSRMERPSVETMGLEELRNELVTTRDCVKTLNQVWQEAESDVAAAEQAGAAWMQKACIEWVQAWLEAGETNTDALLDGLARMPMPNDETEENTDAE
jgi:hypothetical protein